MVILFISLFQVFDKVQQFSRFFLLVKDTTWVFQQHYVSCLLITSIFFPIILWICSFFLLTIGNFSRCFIFTSLRHCSWYCTIFYVEVFLILINQFWISLYCTLLPNYLYFMSFSYFIQMLFYVHLSFCLYLIDIFDAFVPVQYSALSAWILNWISNDFALKDFYFWCLIWKFVTQFWFIRIFFYLLI